jgi:hypothetical protein
MKTGIYFEIFSAQCCLAVRFIGDLDGRTITNSLKEFYKVYAETMNFDCIIDVRHVEGVYSDQEFMAYYAWEMAFRVENGFDPVPTRQLIYLTKPIPGPDPVREQLEYVSKLEMAPVYTAEAAWEKLNPGVPPTKEFINFFK